MHARSTVTLTVMLLTAGGCSTGDTRIVQRSSAWREATPARDAKLPAGPDVTVDEYAAFALSHHPELLAQHERWAAALHDTDAQGTLPDPVVSVMVSPLPIETRLGPQRARVGVRQAFPWPGVLQGQTAVAAKGVDVESARYAATMVTVRGQIARAYWGLWGMQRRARLAADQVVVMEGVAQTLQAGVEVGRTTTSALTQANMEVTQAHDFKQEIDSGLRSARARLVGSLGLQDAPGELAVQHAAPGIALPVPGLEALQAWTAQRPDVLLVSEQVEQRARQLELAQTRAKPSFGLGVEWAEVGNDPAGGMVRSADTGRDALMVTGQVSVPLWFGSYEASVDAAHATWQATQFELEAVRIRALALTSERWAHLNESARKAALLRSMLLPQAQASLQATMTDYIAARTSGVEVLRAQRRLLEVHLKLIDALTQHAIDWAQLEELVARPIPRRLVSVTNALPKDDEKGVSP